MRIGCGVSSVTHLATHVVYTPQAVHSHCWYIKKNALGSKPLFLTPVPRHHCHPWRHKARDATACDARESSVSARLHSCGKRICYIFALYSRSKQAIKLRLPVSARAKHSLLSPHTQAVHAAAADAPASTQNWDVIAGQLESTSPLEIMDHVRLLQSRGIKSGIGQHKMHNAPTCP
jgi:hypothetical protein